MVLEKSSENILWVKIAKGFLHGDREVYLAGVYNSPKYSIYTKEKNCNVIDILREQLTKFSLSDIIFIGGDFNSRVGSQDDFITESENDLDYLPQDYEIDSPIVPYFSNFQVLIQSQLAPSEIKLNL